MRALAQVYGYGLRLWGWDLWPSLLPEDRFLGYVAHDLVSRRPHAYSDTTPYAT